MFRLPIQKGSRIFCFGDQQLVADLVGSGVALRGSDGVVRLYPKSQVFSAEDFEVLDVDYVAEAASTSTFLDSLPPHLLKRAVKRLEHVNEAFTGFTSGSVRAVDAAPRPEYDPEKTTLTERLDAKCRETKWSRRRLFRYKAIYAELGLYGLVDGRSVRLARDGLAFKPELKEVVDTVVRELTYKSTVSIGEIFRQTKLEVERRNEERRNGKGPERKKEEIALPSRAAFYRKFRLYAKGRAINGTAKRRRSIAEEPPMPWGRFVATRPGEFVLIDSSPYDVFAVDPVSGLWVALELTVALDLYTRSILAFRFTPKNPKGVDAALLLHDIIAPKPRLECWSEETGWRYHGVPEAIIVEGTGFPREGAGVAAVPLVNPETVVVDRGRLFVSQVFQDGCARFGISIQLARPRKPTDKPQVERLFRTIRESLLEKLPGYKGPDVASRGLKPEDDAFLFIDELEQVFARWVVEWYQVRPHSGLRLPGQPRVTRSPNEMYEEGLERWGIVHVPPTRTSYLELLPQKWVVINPYGVELNGLRYDDEALNSYRRERSPYNGRPETKGKWPIKYDPRDLSEVFFRDPDTGGWHGLPWVDRVAMDRPFSDLSLRYAKRVLRDRDGNTRSKEQLAETLNEILRRAVEADGQGREERRLFIHERVRKYQLDRDRGAAQLEDVPDTSDDEDDPIGDLVDPDAIDAADIEALGTLDDANDDADDDGLGGIFTEAA